MGLDEEIAQQRANALNPVERRHTRLLLQRDRFRRVTYGYLKAWGGYLAGAMASAAAAIEVIKWWAGK